MKTFQSLLFLAVVAMASGAAAQDLGRFDLDALSDGLKPKVNINFGPAMLRGFGEGLAQANPDLGGVLSNLQGLRVMVFEDVDVSGIEPRIARAIEQLDAEGWSHAVNVSEDDSLVDLYLLEAGELVKGLLLLIRADGDSVVLANVHGDLDPVLVGRLAGQGRLLRDLDFDQFLEQGQSSEQDS